MPRCFHISHYHGIFLPHGSYSAQCHIFERLPDMQHWYTGCRGRNAQWHLESPDTASSHFSVFHSTVRHAYDLPSPDPLATSHSSQKSLKHTVFRLLPSSVRYAIYFNRCSFRTSDGWQRKKPLHPPEIHSFHSDDDFLFPTP